MNSQGSLSRVTVSLPADLAQTLLSIRLRHAVSVSAVAEAAIRSFLARLADEELAAALKAEGAGLRRRSSDVRA